VRTEKAARNFRFLAGYYGLLQTLHLLSLARAGLIVLQGGTIPFPAPPPPGGWPLTSLPFLLGMGTVDVVAIILGLIFVYQLFARGRIRKTLGVISLTIALVSGVQYLIGTLPSGAWQENLVGYIVVLVVFSPVIPLFIALAGYQEGQAS
jgi:multisubunit Na+/H+ antiporter MnhG subunit